MVEFTDEDMAQVGRDLMEEIEAHSGQWPLKGWGPMDTPAEVVTDLINMLVEMRAELERVTGISDVLRDSDGNPQGEDGTASSPDDSAGAQHIAKPSPSKGQDNG